MILTSMDVSFEIRVSQCLTTAHSSPAASVQLDTKATTLKKWNSSLAPKESSGRTGSADL